jgi:hypothetical protein
MPEVGSKYPLRHISIRVPWHDNGWCGTVCTRPELNGSCLRLARISDHRGDAKKKNQCEPVKSKSLQEMDQKMWPCCVAERAMFMSPFMYTRQATHPMESAVGRPPSVRLAHERPLVSRLRADLQRTKFVQAYHPSVERSLVLDLPVQRDDPFFLDWNLGSLDSFQVLVF